MSSRYYTDKENNKSVLVLFRELNTKDQEQIIESGMNWEKSISYNKPGKDGNDCQSCHFSENFINKSNVSYHFACNNPKVVMFARICAPEKLIKDFNKTEKTVNAVKLENYNHICEHFR